MQQVKLRRGSFKHVESELFHYHETMRDIHLLRESILHQTAITDENVGGGKSNLPGDPTGTRAIALLTNRKLDSMTRIVHAIEYVVERLPEEKRRLLELRYWTKPQTLTWPGISMKLNISSRQAHRWREEIVTAIAELLGW